MPYCGRTARVKAKVERFIDEESGRLVQLSCDCYLVDRVVCEATTTNLSQGCSARRTYPRVAGRLRVTEITALRRCGATGCAAGLRQVGKQFMKISFFGHFGTLNSGNESTFIAILSRLRLLSPDCDFCCICTNPESVVARDGIEAVPISTREVRIWNRQTRLDKRLKMAFIGVRQELWQYIRAYNTLKGTDMLIVPGTGLLTDAYGLSAWGPYNIFKWSLMAKLRGCRVVFVSVGAGPIDGALGRFLVKSALSLADYRSYRDTSSMNYLNAIGFRTTDDRVYPDLVFSLPEALLTT